MKNNFIFLNKSLFFPAEGILVIGDLHIGYEAMLRQLGLQISIGLTKDIIDDLKLILEKIKAQYSLKKVIFIGDIKHLFSAEYEEKKAFFKILNLIGKYISSKDIILIKGNHDTFDFSGHEMKNYYIHKDIAFVHGHKDFKAIYSKKIKTIVMGHIHPSISLTDKAKTEKFKCFLVGKFKNKTVIIVPSFFEVFEGTDVNDYEHEYQDNFSIIPKKFLLKFNAFVVGEKNTAYDFGEVGKL